MELSIEIKVPQAVIFDQGTEKLDKKEEKMIRLEPRLRNNMKIGAVISLQSTAPPGFFLKF